MDEVGVLARVQPGREPPEPAGDRGIQLPGQDPPHLDSAQSPMTESPGGPGGGPSRGCSDTFDRFEATGSDRFDELLVVLLVLVGVAFAEVGDRPVERVAAA